MSQRTSLFQWLSFPTRHTLIVLLFTPNYLGYPKCTALCPRWTPFTLAAPFAWNILVLTRLHISAFQTQLPSPLLSTFSKLPPTPVLPVKSVLWVASVNSPIPLQCPSAALSWSHISAPCYSVPPPSNAIHLCIPRLLNKDLPNEDSRK